MTTVKELPNGSKSPSFFRSLVDDLTKIVIPSSGESHQQDELSPVKKVQPERGISPKPLPQRRVAPSANDPSNSTFAPSRCEFTFSDGRHCRYPAKAYPQDELSPANKTIGSEGPLRSPDFLSANAGSAFLNYYGHPIKLAVPPAGGTATPGCAHPNPSASRSKPPTVPDPEICSSAPVAAAVPQAKPSASDPADLVAPPSRRHRKPRSHSSVPGSAPHSELPSPFPISATPAKHDSLGGPDADHHEGHRTDWYAPPSWSKIRPPDPCPSRKEKLQRKLRSMSNSAFRRLQHQNSRGFWNKALQKLTP
jgi:hypothetical protein